MLLQPFLFRMIFVDSWDFARFSARRSLSARADCFELLTADLSAIVAPSSSGHHELILTIPRKVDKSTSASGSNGGVPCRKRSSVRSQEPQ